MLIAEILPQQRHKVNVQIRAGHTTLQIAYHFPFEWEHSGKQSIYRKLQLKIIVVRSALHFLLTLQLECTTVAQSTKEVQHPIVPPLRLSSLSRDKLFFFFVDLLLTTPHVCLVYLYGVDRLLVNLPKRPCDDKCWDAEVGSQETSRGEGARPEDVEPVEEYNDAAKAEADPADVRLEVERCREG